ncbi:50S ribosomal protein L25 [Candidatus Peribacteria bacterium]|nr:50S ribosomal protein L25 [Candidatus Peribacteria bacterium]
MAYTLTATKRDTRHKHSAREARAANTVPAVVYGSAVQPQAIALPYSAVLKTYRDAGSSSIITLDVEGKKHDVLIHDIQLHPVKDTILHIDFQAVKAGEKIIVQVPIELVGESRAVKTLGGILVHDHDTIAIRCLPKDIPAEITVDISVLKDIHDHICVKDLSLDPKKHEVMHLEPGSPVCSVTGHSTAEEENSTDAPVEPEVIGAAASEEDAE